MLLKKVLRGCLLEAKQSYRWLWRIVTQQCPRTFNGVHACFVGSGVGIGLLGRGSVKANTNSSTVNRWSFEWILLSLRLNASRMNSIILLLQHMQYVVKQNLQIGSSTGSLGSASSSTRNRGVVVGWKNEFFTSIQYNLYNGLSNKYLNQALVFTFFTIPIKYDDFWIRCLLMWTLKA